MFIYYFVHIPTDFVNAERAVLDLMSGMGELAEHAYRDGEQIRARIGVGGDPPRLAKSVEIACGTPLRGEHQTTIPLTWEATGTPGLFPRMEADLVVAALGPSLTQLVLRGTYRPPLGKIGRALDRALLHRIAEASVKAFLERIADGVLDRRKSYEPAESPRR